MGFQREEEGKIDFGGGGAVGDGEEIFFQKNWILIVCVWVYCFICKILTWHFRIGGYKISY